MSVAQNRPEVNGTVLDFCDQRKAPALPETHISSASRTSTRSYAPSHARESTGIYSNEGRTVTHFRLLTEPLTPHEVAIFNGLQSIAAKVPRTKEPPAKVAQMNLKLFSNQSRSLFSIPSAEHNQADGSDAEQGDGGWFRDRGCLQLNNKIIVENGKCRCCSFAETRIP